MFMGIIRFLLGYQSVSKIGSKIGSKYQSRRRSLKQLPEPALLQAQMDQWLQSHLGQEMMRVEKGLLEPVFSRLFGYHLLQIGCSTDSSLWDSSPIGHKFMFTPKYFPNCANAVGETEALPLANNSVDAVLLHHALDFTPNSHRLLREATRVIIAGGRIFILAFNPRSSWGLYKRLSWSQELPWRGRFISSGRIVDWLELLDFHVEKLQHGLFALPFDLERLIKYSRAPDKFATHINFPLGSVYLIVASKRVAPMTPVARQWRQRAKTRPLAVPATDHARMKGEKIS